MWTRLKKTKTLRVVLLLFAFAANGVIAPDDAALALETETAIELLALGVIALVVRDAIAKIEFFR